MLLVAECQVEGNSIDGHTTWIKWVKDGVKKRCGITEMGMLKKHFGVWYD